MIEQVFYQKINALAEESVFTVSNITTMMAVYFDLNTSLADLDTLDVANTIC